MYHTQVPSCLSVVRDPEAKESADMSAWLLIGDVEGNVTVSQFPHKSVNLSLTITNMKDNLTDLCGD